MCVAAVSESTTYGRTVEEAQAFLLGLLGWMLEGQQPHRRAASAAALRATLMAHQTEVGVRFASTGWLVTARRPKTSSWRRIEEPQLDFKASHVDCPARMSGELLSPSGRRSP